MGSASTLAELAGKFATEKPRGEYVLVVGPRNDRPVDEADPQAVRSAYQRALDEGLDRRTALRQVSAQLGIRRRLVFDILATDSQVDED